MKFTKRLVIYGSALALVAMGGVYSSVRAQESEGGGAAGLDVTVHSDATMTPQAQLKWVEDQMASAKSVSYRVQGMLDQARKEKDILRITCINDKLTQIHVNLRGIEERLLSLRASVNGGDSASANQQFAILKIYISRIQGLRGEAENCIGEVDVVLGQTETLLEISDDITLNTPEDSPATKDVAVTQFPKASGYRLPSNRCNAVSAVGWPAMALVSMSTSRGPLTCSS